MSLIKLQGNASGTGALTIAAPNTNTDRTLTLPDTTGTIVMNEGSGIFKIDSSGKVGIGTSSPAEELHLQAAAPTLRLQDSDDSAYTNFIQNSGGFRIDVDPTAAGAASFFRVDVDATERMRIDSSGNVGIGTATPTDLVQVVGGNILIGTDSGDPFNSQSRVRIQGAGSEYIQIKGDGTGQLGLLFGDASDNFLAGVLSDQGSGNDLRFNAANAERMRIDSSGNVGIGLTTPSDVLDVAAPIDGGIRISESTNNNRFCKITQSTARLTLSADPNNATSTSYINFLVDGTEYMRVHALGVVTMPAVYGDTVTGRDLFIAADGQLGYVSSTRASKTNIQDLSDVSWLYNLNPVSFQYRVKNEDDTYSDEAQPQPEYGLIAEEVELVNPDLVFYDETENGKELRGIQYSRLIAPLLKAIQEQQSLITDLTARVAQLEAN